MTLFADQRLDGRVVIVTGGTQGLGEAIALRAAALGAAGIASTSTRPCTAPTGPT